MRQNPRAGPPQRGRKLKTKNPDPRNGRVVERLMKKSAPNDADLSKNLPNIPQNEGHGYQVISKLTVLLKFTTALSLFIQTFCNNGLIVLPKIPLFVLTTQVIVGKLSEIIQLFRSAGIVFF